MSNKQNHPLQSRSSIYLTHQPKSRNRYPLLDREVKREGNILDSPPVESIRDRSKCSYGPSRQNDELLLKMSKHIENGDNSEPPSMQLKFKLMHINSVHELIASAREKKSEIEDLLRSEALKAENDQQMETSQIAASLRKLKKVVRLMEIVCKIIMGKNEQNSYMDASLQNDVSMRQMHSFSIDNFERELVTKNSQIARLKKLVELLSAPNNKEDLKRSQLSNNNDYSLVQNSLNLVVESNKKEESSFSQIKRKEGINMGVQTVQSCSFDNAQDNFAHSQKTKLEINEQYSLWNILDAGVSQGPEQHESMQCFMTEAQSKKSTKPNCILNSKPQKQTSVCQVQTAKRCFDYSAVPFVRVEPKPMFLKRYKSIVKQALNAINLCNKIFTILNKCAVSQTQALERDIESTSNYFNKEYNSIMADQNSGSKKGNQSKSCHQFCKEIRDRINRLYERSHQIFDEIKYSRDDLD